MRSARVETRKKKRRERKNNIDLFSSAASSLRISFLMRSKCRMLRCHTTSARRSKSGLLRRRRRCHMVASTSSIVKPTAPHTAPRRIASQLRDARHASRVRRQGTHERCGDKAHMS
eukprot:3536486-Rhodomonas_salina.2